MERLAEALRARSRREGDLVSQRTDEPRFMNSAGSQMSYLQESHHARVVERTLPETGQMSSACQKSYVIAGQFLKPKWSPTREDMSKNKKFKENPPCIGGTQQKRRAIHTVAQSCEWHGKKDTVQGWGPEIPLPGFCRKPYSAKTLYVITLSLLYWQFHHNFIQQLERESKATVTLELMQSRATSLSLFTFMHWRRKWQPTPVSLPGESQGRESLVGCRLWGRTESGTTEVT